MVLKLNTVLLISALIIAVTVVLVTQYTPLLFTSTSPSEAHVIVNGKAIAVEIADEPDEMQQGLMFRESLPKDRGMLFVFSDDGIHSFWMMNVKFSLDMIWTDRNGMIVHVERSVPPCSALCPSYRSDVPARYVLEVNSGFADANGVIEGSRIELHLPKGGQ